MIVLLCIGGDLTTEYRGCLKKRTSSSRPTTAVVFVKTVENQIGPLTQTTEGTTTEIRHLQESRIKGLTFRNRSQDSIVLLQSVEIDNTTNNNKESVGMACINSSRGRSVRRIENGNIFLSVKEEWNHRDVRLRTVRGLRTSRRLGL